MRQIIFAFFLLILTALPAMAAPQSANNLKNFDLVWRTVYKEHFDPNFGGVDWKDLYRIYRPRVEQAKNLAEFTRIINEMLFKLKLSHLMVFSENDLKTYIPTLFAEGSVGINLRWVQNRAIITRIKRGSPADKAGLRPGYVINRINGRLTSEFLTEVQWPPPLNQQNRSNLTASYLMGLLDGPPGTHVKLGYSDETDQAHQLEIIRDPRGAGQIISPAMPAFHIEFEARLLPNDIGYIWFNHFAPPVDIFFEQALQDFQNTRGLIIDLRGNPGGYFSIMDRIVARLVETEGNLYQLQFRDKTIQRKIKPAETTYKQPIAILIDVTSMSTSELFSACMQALGRAIIIGERSPGYLLGAKWIRLQNNLFFMHTNLLPLPLSGRIVEGNGIIPNIEIALEHNLLLKGKDSQLEAAREYFLKMQQD
ncbi:MAG: S41 family peptidase [Deltaproteobacteria bacterium]|nr:S41 family peptidase [Deltaproteobacteria bacterium]